jgi:hypothetical protein
VADLDALVARRDALRDKVGALERERDHIVRILSEAHGVSPAPRPRRRRRIWIAAALGAVATAVAAIVVVVRQPAREPDFVTQLGKHATAMCACRDPACADRVIESLKDWIRAAVRASPGRPIGPTDLIDAEVRAKYLEWHQMFTTCHERARGKPPMTVSQLLEACSKLDGMTIRVGGVVLDHSDCPSCALGEDCRPCHAYIQLGDSRGHNVRIEGNDGSPVPLGSAPIIVVGTVRAEAECTVRYQRFE